MENEERKLCVLLYLGALSHQGNTSGMPHEDIECMESECQWWNEDAKECGLIVKKVIKN
ncbi:MAG: hypothetical protein JRF50_16010 [Deltaproteobacteria bacterium]|nr:hypothetical protein [Deltaproteobacteria bacterium]